QWTSSRDGGQKETHQAHVQWTPDLRPGENLRADQILSRTRESQTGIFTGHDRVTGQ
ncbi:hypothetical protein MHYP_G00353320, partial [Metynnis hypsauchen]